MQNMYLSRIHVCSITLHMQPPHMQSTCVTHASYLILQLCCYVLASHTQGLASNCPSESTPWTHWKTDLNIKEARKYSEVLKIGQGIWSSATPVHICTQDAYAAVKPMVDWSANQAHEIFIQLWHESCVAPIFIWNVNLQARTLLNWPQLKEHAVPPHRIPFQLPHALGLWKTSSL